MPEYVSRRSTEVQELARITDRISFLYLEKCDIHRADNAITVETVNQVVHVPAAGIACLLLGPGTRISHQGIALLTGSGTTAVWVGEHGVRFYAHGQSLAHTSRLIEAQAAVVSNPKTRLRVAREMYAMRFPGEDTSALTMQQLRGREGARIKAVYRAEAERTGVAWNRRDYDPSRFAEGDPINQALSAANSCLYGVIQSAIVALGCSPSLGVVHNGHHRSFVYDIADLYKTETSIPVAFESVARTQYDIATVVRHEFRDRQFEKHLLPRACRDIQKLLVPDEEPDSAFLGDVIYLWDEKLQKVAGGRSYADFPW